MRNIIMIRQSMKMALQNIIGNKMRSFLTMLGIVIGVASVIGLITLVQSATGSIMSEFESLGAGTITISAQGTISHHGLSESDLETLRNLDGVDAVAPSASLTTSAVYNGNVVKNIEVDGEDAVYFQHNTETLQSGRIFNTAEAGGETNVAIVDTDFVTNVLNGNGAVGTEFILNGYHYKVIGVKAQDTNVSSFFSGSSSKGTVIVPYKNALKMSSLKNVTSVSVYYSEENISSSELQEELKQALNGIFGTDEDNADQAYSLISMDSLMDTMSTVQTMLSTMLGGIASIALVVGGIGIMNMMLVSVSERTKEIGLRKALGAEPARIQMQFLIESITLSLMGGCIGIVLGLIIALVGTKLLSTSFQISYSAIALGAGFSAAVGIIFGWMPARRASRLNPIDALRSE